LREVHVGPTTNRQTVYQAKMLPWHSPETWTWWLSFMRASGRRWPLGRTRSGGDLLGAAALEEFTPRYIRFDLRRRQNVITAASVNPIKALTTTTSNTSRALVM
jgi:hypothetical protein